MDSKIRCDADDLGLPAELFKEHQAHDWLDTGAALILILLLSLGLRLGGLSRLWRPR